MQHSTFLDELFEQSPFDGIYEALRNKDLADCVVQAARALEQTNNFMAFKKIEKSCSVALQLWVNGTEAFSGGAYEKALASFNLALMRAPPNSEPIRLTYSSRAVLFLKMKQFRACIKDIETCLALSCPDFLVITLQEMRAEASKYTWIEYVARKQFSTPFAEEFFKLKGPRNPDIPCATSDVEVIVKSGQPKVVAARDIPVGTVVAVETAFTATTHIKNRRISCHYCLKMDLNLIPCEGCCSVMFCDKRCRDKAMQEGHDVECKIMEIIMGLIKPAVKATLKIRQLCSSWDEFISASNDLGADRMKNSTFAEIFGTEKFSLLNSNYDIHFFYGALFRRSLLFANVIHYLDTHTSFLPNSPDDKSAAIRAVSRVMMHLSLFCTKVQLRRHDAICIERRATFLNYPNEGYFPFIGKLANSCLPNSYVAGLWNSAALVILAPVKKGAELTFSYAGHWLEVIPKETLMRPKTLLHQFRTICKDCIICGGLADSNILNVPLNDTQEKAFKIFFKFYDFQGQDQDVKTDYKEICKILLALSDKPCSKEYVKAYVPFIQCLRHVVQFNFPNFILE